MRMYRDDMGRRFPNWLHIYGSFRSGPQGTGAEYTWENVLVHRDHWLPQTPLACRLLNRQMTGRVDE